MGGGCSGRHNGSVGRKREIRLEGEGRFWEDRWESVGAQLTDAAGKTIYTDGYALSNSMGISMMVVNREREPVVVVQPRKTTEIEWQVLER